MRRILLFCVIMFFGFGLIGHMQANAQEVVKAALVRDGNLWIKTSNDERQITKGGGVSSPKWSYDGKWIAYVKEVKQDSWKQQLWVYNVQKDQSRRVFLDHVYDYRWAPDQDVLAFLDGNVLDIVDLEHGRDHHFKNVALGINNFAWLPDGSGFLASSSGHLLPTGWTTPILYKIPADATLSSDKIKRFFEIPKDQIDMPATGTSTFKWSPDKKWIAFLVVPTASISADSNTLCVLSSDGKAFKTLDEVLNDETWFKWAPMKNKLAYVSGIDRFSLKGKELKVKEPPAFIQGISFTPRGYVDRDFAWINSHVITVSRAKERNWTNDPDDWPNPYLVRVNIQAGTQKKWTAPPRGNGDFYPKYLAPIHKLSWVRSNGKKADVFIGAIEDSNPSIWIRDIDVAGNYYGRWFWDSVLDWYVG